MCIQIVGSCENVFCENRIFLDESSSMKIVSRLWRLWEYVLWGPVRICSVRICSVRICPVGSCENMCTGWRRHIGSLIFIGHFLQKWPIFSGSSVEYDLQLRWSYESSPPYIQIVGSCGNMFCENMFCENMSCGVLWEYVYPNCGVLWEYVLWEYVLWEYVLWGPVRICVSKLWGPVGTCLNLNVTFSSNDIA